jgi:hypothetical protein
MPLAITSPMSTLNAEAFCAVRTLNSSGRILAGPCLKGLGTSLSVNRLKGVFGQKVAHDPYATGGRAPTCAPPSTPMENLRNRPFKDRVARTLAGGQ